MLFSPFLTQFSYDKIRLFCNEPPIHASLTLSEYYINFLFLKIIPNINSKIVIIWPIVTSQFIFSHSRVFHTFAFLLLPKYVIEQTINKISDKICETLMEPNIKLSVLRPSTKNLTKAYPIKYVQTI